MDEKLKAALMAAKSKAHNFAIVAKGPTVVFLLVSKTPIKNDVVLAAKKEHAGNAVIRGTCEGKEGELVFRVAKDPPVQNKKLKEFIVTATSIAIKPRFEVVTNEEVEGEGQESDEAAGGVKPPQAGETAAVTTPPPKAPPLAPSLPPAATGDAAAFTNRLKALKTDLDMVRGAETSVTAEVKTLSAELAAVAGKKQFAAADKILDRIEPLVKKGKAELSAHAGPRAGDAGSAGGSNAAAKAALADWQTARGAAIAQLQELANALKGYDHPNSDQAYARCRAVQSNLSVKPETRQSVNELEGYLQSDQIVAAVEQPNGFGITVALRKPLLAALSKLRPPELA